MPAPQTSDLGAIPHGEVGKRPPPLKFLQRDKACVVAKTAARDFVGNPKTSS
jgi:hypothetical protein